MTKKQEHAATSLLLAITDLLADDCPNRNALDATQQEWAAFRAMGAARDAFPKLFEGKIYESRTRPGQYER